MRKSNVILVFIISVLIPVLILTSCAGLAESVAIQPPGSHEQGGEKTAPEGSLAESGEDDETPGVPGPEPAESEKKESSGLKASESSKDDAVAFMEEVEVYSTGAAEPDYGDTEEYRSGSPSPAAASRGSAPSVSGLKAGFSDDNKQYGYFLNFLEEYSGVPHIELPVMERIVLKVTDGDGKAVPNGDIEIRNGSTVTRGKTMADGRFLLFPSEYPGYVDTFTATVSVMQETRELTIPRTGKREIEVQFPFPRIIPGRVPLDILFVLDTTGSMGEEINRLRTTIELIHLNLTNLSTRPRVRFGMVLYKDLGDEYRTRVVPLTDNLAEFQEALALVEASGGGDTPEDLQAAMDVAVNRIQWNREGIRLAFIITDAPPHIDYGQEFDYAEASRKAKASGIKFYGVGTGGLDLMGEYILRQIAQYTSGRYIFLTYGESGESEGGSPGSVSHHTGSNFQTDKLEAIIIRFAKEELSYLTDEPIEFEDPYFEANKIDSEKREETLEKLFTMAFTQLVDYSAFPIGEKTAVAVLPVIPASEELALNSEYFTEQILLSAGKSGYFTLVERQDMQSIMEEIKLQLSGVINEDTTVEIGNLLGARALISGKLYAKTDDFELFLRLLRVETGEVLSVTRAVIAKELGL